MTKKITPYKLSLHSDEFMIIIEPTDYDPKSQKILVSLDNKVVEGVFNPSTKNITAKVTSSTCRTYNSIEGNFIYNPLRVKVFTHDFKKKKVINAKSQDFAFNPQILSYEPIGDLVSTVGLIVGNYDKDKLEHNESNIFQSYWWSTDFHGVGKITRSELGETVYFQLRVDDKIKVGTKIRFTLWDYDTALFIDSLKEDDAIPEDNQTAIVGTVRKEQNENRITLKLYLDLKWIKELKEDQGTFRDSDLDLYWRWSYGYDAFSSENSLLSVYPSTVTLRLKPAYFGTGYNLPEIYSRSGEVILYAIDEAKKGEIIKFVSIKIRNTEIYKFKKGLQEFKKEIYTASINLSSNNITSVKRYQVTEVNHYFNIKDDFTKIFINEEIVDVPVTAGSKFARYNSMNKAWNFAKSSVEIFDRLDVLNQMKNMIPELSNNNEFNLPSLSTFIGFIRSAQIYAFIFTFAEMVIIDQTEKQNKIINDSLWLKWENTKRQGLEKVISFIENNRWAEENNFEMLEISIQTLQDLFIGKFTSYEQLLRGNSNDKGPKEYVVITYEESDEQLDTFTKIIDCVIIID